MNAIKKNRVIFIIVLLLFLLLIVSVPSLAKLKNRNTIYDVSNWDGTVATSYKRGDGSEENPYVISDASEFAFFIQQLKTTNYSGINFELSNDIVINIGVFEYDELEGLKYILDNTTYYVKEFTNEYYDNVNREGTSIGTINLISPSSEFKGNFNGNSFTIFGMYISSSEKENLSLFETLEGNINDLYISNSVVYGKGDVAGISNNLNNSTLSNIIYDGYVINKSNAKTSSTNINSFSVTSNMLESNTVLSIPEVLLEGNIKSVKLSGEYEITNLDASVSMKINGIDVTSNKFEIDLGTDLLTQVNISSTSTIDSTLINFTNLKYIIEYYDDVTSGVAINSSNNYLNNVINKADIYGNYMSCGFIGNSTDNLEINKGYNTGKITSNYMSSGFVGKIRDNANHTTITNVYNNGLILSLNSAGILGEAKNNTGLININNTINISDSYAINNIELSTVNVSNSYSTSGLSVYSGNANGLFAQVAIENLYSKDFMKNISYSEFIGLDDIKNNLNNAWIYGINDLPILYIDDLNNPIANITLGKYSWNNLSTELNVLKISNNITFNINSITDIYPIKEKYYYVTNSVTPLTVDELNNITEWKLYENEVTLDKSGYYVIYAKIIDMNDQVTYINTDVIALDVSGFQANISLNEKTWTDFSENLENVYINKQANLRIYAYDDLLDITSIQYYISSDKLTVDELNNITEWNNYVDTIEINSLEKYIVYAKIIDSESNVRYLNTDYIIYSGYTETLTLGNSEINYDTNNITSKSSIKLKFEGDLNFEYKDGYSHNLISNILLPVGTEITLIDKISNKVYKKNIDTEEDLYGYADSGNKNAIYNFEMFKQVGINETKYYDESLNYNKIISKEKFVVIIDFSKTNINNNYNDAMFSLSIKSNNGEYLYQTLNNTISNINIFSTINNLGIETIHSLNSDYANQVIQYNSDSQTNINFVNSISYSQINNKNIIDTLYESKKVGLLIGLYNQNGDRISKDYLDNMVFEINGKEYFAGSDNLIRINLNSAVNLETKTLKIKTKENSSYLASGSYYIKINKFISDDGYYYENLYSDELIIPIEVLNENTPIPNYSFDVTLNNNDIILDKSLENKSVLFQIAYSGELIEPNIKISLYEKKDLTAYNQNYVIVDLKNYTTDQLVSVGDNNYFVDVSSNTFNLNLLTSKFNNNGYKYVFELYDSNKKISKIEKYFIVR